MRSPHTKTPAPAPSSEPDFSFLTDWKSSPAITAAGEAAETAEATWRARCNDLERATQHLAELRQRGDVDFHVIDAAELAVRRADHGRQMAQDAAIKCAEAWDRAEHDAKLATIAQCEAEFAEKQRQIFFAGYQLCQANQALYALGREVEKQFGPVFPKWHLEGLAAVNFDGLLHYAKTARWLPKDGDTRRPSARPDPDKVRVLALKPGVEGSALHGNNPGEVCWVPRSELPSLIKQRAVRPAQEGDFELPREPLADMLGNVAVRFKSYFDLRLPSGIKKWFSAGDEARINKDLAYGAVVVGDAEYVADQSSVPSE